MQRTTRSFTKNVKERKECFVLFIKNTKERENVSFFRKERKRIQERCVLLKRTYAQPCQLAIPSRQNHHHDCNHHHDRNHQHDHESSTKTTTTTGNKLDDTYSINMTSTTITMTTINPNTSPLQGQ